MNTDLQDVVAVSVDPDAVDERGNVSAIVIMADGHVLGVEVTVN